MNSSHLKRFLRSMAMSCSTWMPCIPMGCRSLYQLWCPRVIELALQWKEQVARSIVKLLMRHFACWIMQGSKLKILNVMESIAECDGEHRSMMDPVKDGLEVDMNCSNAQDHEPRAECDNCTVKEALRVTLHHVAMQDCAKSCNAGTCRASHWANQHVSSKGRHARTLQSECCCQQAMFRL